MNLSKPTNVEGALPLLAETLVAPSLPEPLDPAWARWRAQPWRRQLHRFEDFTRPLDRQALVRRLVREGMTPAAELAWLAGHIEAERAPEHLTIQQVVRFADSLIERVANAGADELIRITYLQRNAAGLANRMIEWVNTGRL